MASRPRFFFNSTSGQCELFVFGCLFNQNVFKLQKTCESTCASKAVNAYFLCLSVCLFVFVQNEQVVLEKVSEFTTKKK